MPLSETLKTLTESPEPFFVFGYFVAGLAFIIATIVFTIYGWRYIIRNFADGYRLQALLLTFTDILLVSFGLWFLTNAFPRLPGYIIVGVVAILVLVVSTGSVITKEKSAAGGAKEGGEAPGGEKK